MLLVVLATKFTHGAWVALLGMVIFYGTMSAIRKHYDRVAEELAAPEGPSDDSLRPSRVHSVVLISKIHRPALRALALQSEIGSAIHLVDTVEEAAALVDAAPLSTSADGPSHGA